MSVELENAVLVSERMTISPSQPTRWPTDSAHNAVMAFEDGTRFNADKLYFVASYDGGSVRCFAISVAKGKPSEFLMGGAD